MFVSSSSCRPIKSADLAYKYHRIASDYVTNVDDIAVLADDPDEWYQSRIDPMQSNGIKWDIVAGPRVVVANGTDEVRSLWKNFSERSFAFHQWSHFSSCTKPNGDLQIDFRYHATVREREDANIQDAFGSAVVVVKTAGDRADLITEVSVLRSETLERPY